MQSAPHLLIVDDDLEIRKLLGQYFTAQNFRVTLASDRRTMMEALASHEISLVVLDVMLPDGSGLEMCRNMRAENSQVPIILLTALKEEVDRIIGLEVGADDYLGKPFNPRELLARVRSVLRRRNGVDGAPLSEANEYRFEDFTLQATLRRVVRQSGEVLEFTSAEFELLQILITRPGRVLSREQLLELTSRGNADVFDRSIDVLMSRIRRKLGDDGKFQLIKTVRNGGYVFSTQVEKIGKGNS